MFSFYFTGDKSNAYTIYLYVMLIHNNLLSNQSDQNKNSNPQIDNFKTISSTLELFETNI